MTRRGRPLVWVAALVTCGCAGTPVSREGADRRTRFPESRYLVAEGMSRSGPVEAEAQAKARVSEQVRAEVESVVEDLSGVRDGQDYQRVLNEVRVTSHFQHAELIRAHSEPGRGRDGLFHALAVLDRAEAVTVLMEEYRRDSERFRLEVGRALAAKGHPVRFTPPLRQAEAVFARLALEALQVRVIEGRGRFPAEHEADREAFSRLEAARSQVLADLTVTVLPGEVEPPMARERVVQALTSALASSGVVTVSAAVCRGGLAVVPEARLACSQTFVGVTCRVTLGGSVKDCTGRSRVATLALGEVATGAHPKDKDLARAEALRAVTGATLAPRLREQLREVIPLP